MNLVIHPGPSAQASRRRSAILGLGSQEHCHQAPLAPGFQFVQPKEDSREMRKPGVDKKARREKMQRDGSRSQISLFLLRPDLTATLQRSSTSFAGLTEVSAAGSCSTATLPHSSPLPRPLACGPAGLMPLSGPLLVQVRPPLLLCSPALEMVAVLAVINSWTVSAFQFLCN